MSSQKDWPQKRGPYIVFILLKNTKSTLLLFKIVQLANVIEAVPLSPYYTMYTSVHLVSNKKSMEFGMTNGMISKRTSVLRSLFHGQNVSDSFVCKTELTSQKKCRI